MIAEGAGGTARVARRTRAGRLAVLVLAGVVAAVTLSGCSAGDIFYLGWPKGGITDQSHRMFNLWVGSVIAALVVGLFVWALIFWCVVRYRKRGDELPVQTRYNLPIEVLYTIVPFLIISVLFYYTAVVEAGVDKVSTDPDVRVEVVAFKWNWQFRYLDAKGSDGQPVSTIGTTDYVPVLVVPTNERIRFVEKSTDVIHSFWVPDMLFKRDVFPGNVTNTFEVTIRKEGAYVGHCAELCGTYHSMMNFELRAVTPAQFDQFIAAKKRGLSTPDALGSAGFTGNDRYAITTKPFDERDNRASS